MNTEDEIAKTLAKAFEAPEPGTITFSHEADVSGVDLEDNSLEESLIAEDAKSDGVDVPDMPEDKEADIDSVFDDAPMDDVKQVMNSTFNRSFDFSEITIDAMERDRFYRSGLHDEEMYYDVEIPNSGMTIRVAIPRTSLTEATMAALDSWVASGLIGTNSSQYLYGFQLISAWLMVRNINRVPTGWYEQALDEAGGKLSYNKICKLLADPETIECIRDIQEVRWSAITTAIRIADYKHQMCIDALRTRKVFTTADSA